MAQDDKPESGGRSAEQTRLALIRAGLQLFGQKGFEATSTRELARQASANIGSIAYHFGGKEGLREACARYVVEQIGAVAGRALARQPAGTGPDAARDRLVMVMETMVAFIVAQPEAGEIARFVVRELSQPSVTIDIVYGGIFEPVHRQLCDIWEEASGQPADSPETMLSVFTMIGQLIYFRIGREAVLRRMGWDTIGPEESAQIVAVARANLDAVLAARRGERP